MNTLAAPNLLGYDAVYIFVYCPCTLRTVQTPNIAQKATPKLRIYMVPYP